MDQQSKEGAPFNMAIDTLQRIAHVIDKLSEVSTSPYPLDNPLQVKFNLLQQLFIQSVPLLKSDKEATIKESLGNLKKKLVQPKTIYDESGYPRGKEYQNAPELDDEINSIEIEIQNALQDEGYFMPPKSDPRFAWKRG